MSFTGGRERVYDAGVSGSLGIRDYLVRVYNYMLIALGVTGISALVVASSGFLINLLFGTPLHWLVLFAPLVISIVMSSKVHSMSRQMAMTLLVVFSVSMGASLSSIFVLYTGQSITKSFFITASMFGVMAMYGNITKRDLSNFGSILIMGVVGLIIASIINIFMHSTALQFAVSVLGVFIFTFLTAHDAQRIKNLYYSVDGVLEANVVNNVAVVGAVSLYFNFINIFMSLLQLIGDRRD